MARQKGIFQVHGSIGNVRNYQLTGDRHITSALKGGPSALQIQTLPSLASTYLRNKEWRGVSLMTKYIYNSMRVTPFPFFDRFFCGRIVKLCSELIKRDTIEPFGARFLLVTGERPFMASLVLNPGHRLSSVLKGVPIITFLAEHNITRLEWQYHIPITTMENTFDFFATETHVRTFQILSSVSDVWYNPANMAYNPLDTNFPYLGQVKVSDWLARTDIVATELTLTDTLVPAWFTPGDDDSVYQIVGIEFGRLEGAEVQRTPHFGIDIIDLA